VIRRLLAAVGVVLVVEVVLAATGHDLHPVEITLLVAVGALVVALVIDFGGRAQAAWPQQRPETPLVPVERRLAAYARMIESNQTARRPDALVRDLLRGLVDERLDRRHGLTRADPAAADLLGPELLAVLDGPPVLIRPARLSAYLDRIESL